VRQTLPGLGTGDSSARGGGKNDATKDSLRRNWHFRSERCLRSVTDASLIEGFERFSFAALVRSCISRPIASRHRLHLLLARIWRLSVEHVLCSRSLFTPSSPIAGSRGHLIFTASPHPKQAAVCVVESERERERGVGEGGHVLMRESYKPDERFEGLLLGQLGVLSFRGANSQKKPFFAFGEEGKRLRGEMEMGEGKGFVACKRVGVSFAYALWSTSLSSAARWRGGRLSSRRLCVLLFWCVRGENGLSKPHAC